MTHHVLLKDWKPGLHKISLTKILQERAGLSLHEAHDRVERLLDGETIVVPMADATAAVEFARAAEQIGAVAVVALAA